LFAGQASFLGLLLQNVAGQQLALGIGRVFEFGADVEAVSLAVAMGHACAQQQAKGLWHQHQFDRQVSSGGNRRGVLKVDAAFGDDHRLWLADLPKHGDSDHLAQQIDAFILGFQEGGEVPVALADLAQQVLRLEFAQVQFAEQVEEWGSILQHFLACGFGSGQGPNFQCDRVLDTVVFAAIFFI